jgi:pyruvate/oxaloacetate carboxyltransferase
MSLDPEDPIPSGISPRKAYSAIIKYLKSNRDSFLPENNPPRNLMGDIIPGASLPEFAVEGMLKTVALIDRLPEERVLREVDIKAVLGAVTSGKLEVAYHRSDGDFKMAAYAQAAMQLLTGEKYSSLSKEEESEVLEGIFGNSLFY